MVPTVLSTQYSRALLIGSLRASLFFRVVLLAVPSSGSGVWGVDEHLRDQYCN
jgi:hypothetical protein